MNGVKSTLLALTAPLAIAGCEGHTPPGYNSQKPEDRQAITSLMTDFACRCAQFGTKGDYSDIKSRAETLAPQIDSEFVEDTDPHRTLTLRAIGNPESLLWSNVHYSMTCGPDNALKARDPCTYYTAQISSAVANAACTNLSDIPWTNEHDGGCDPSLP